MLNRAVFQAPDFAKAGAQLAQQQSAKKEAIVSERNSTVEAGGLEKKFFGEDFGKLTPLGKKATKAAYDAWKEKSINYKTTGSEVDKEEMMYAQQQFNEILGAELAIASNLVDISKKYVESGGKGFAERDEEFKLNVGNFRNMDANVELKNGQIYVNGMPYNQFERYSITPNRLNRPDVNVIDPRSQFLDVSKRAQTYVDTLKSTKGVQIEDPEKGVFYNIQELKKKSLASFEIEMQNPELRDAVILRHVFSTQGINPNTMSQAEIDSKIKEYESNEILFDAAKSMYVTELSKEIDRLAPSSNLYKSSASSKDGSTSATQFVNVMRAGSGRPTGFVYRVPQDPIKWQWDGSNYEINGVEFNSDGSIKEIKAVKKTPRADGDDLEQISRIIKSGGKDKDGKAEDGVNVNKSLVLSFERYLRDSGMLSSILSEGKRVMDLEKAADAKKAAGI